MTNEKIITLENLATYNDKINQTKQDVLVSGQNIKTINNESILGEGDIKLENSILSLSYSELVTLRDNAQLMPGQYYRITDYVTTTTQRNTQSAGHPFDVIVMAMSPDTLSHNAFAEKSNTPSGWIVKTTESGSTVDTERTFTLSDKLINIHGTNVLLSIVANDLSSGHLLKRTGDMSWEDSDGVVYTSTVQNPEFGSTMTDVGGVEYMVMYSERPWYAFESSETTSNNFVKTLVHDELPTTTPVNSEFNGDTKGVYFKVVETEGGMYVPTALLGMSHMEVNVTEVLYNNYFSNADLAAWQLWYDIDNDTTKYTWTDGVNGKGVIYRMIDEHGNDCPYDFKNIQFKRKTTNGVLDTENGIDTWCYTFNAYCEDDASIYDATVIARREIIDDDDANRCHENIIKEWYGTANNEGLILNDIVFLNIYSIESPTYFHCHSNSFGNECCNNTFGNYCYSNSFGNYCHSNSFGNYCMNNSFGNNCDRNSFGNECRYNLFGNYCHSNSFGNYCMNNSFGNECYSNSFGNECRYNLFGNYCHDNSVEFNCESNSFGNSCWDNSFGDSCSSNSFGNECYSNSFGYSSNYNSFGNSCYSNSFGDSCSSNSFRNECYSNSFGDGCDYNSFGNKCYYNTFGDGCLTNSFGNNCYSNTFRNGCWDNSFGNNCWRNSFGYSSDYNSFGNNCVYNSFRVSAETSSALKNYVRYNHLDDGCSYNVIWNSNTTSSSILLKNININRGVCGTSGSYNYINIETLNSEKEINVNNYNGHIYIDYGDIFNVTYSELVELRDNSQLIPGRQYRIIDYVTTTSQKNTQSAGNPFDIIVTALDEGTLSEEAQAAKNRNDDYFDGINLSAWKLWYSLDNDTNRFTWAGDVKTGEIERKIYDSSECTINPELIDGNSFITPFNFTSCVWVDGNGDGNIEYGGESNHDAAELIYEWGYFTDENDDTQLCLYKSDAGLYEEEGQPDYGDKYLYRGVVNVDGTDYDYWQKWDQTSNDNGDFNGINVGGTGDYVYATTVRIVSNPEAYNEIIETEDIYESGKGVIYRMIDEFGNDCPYDFKNIMFKHPNDTTTYPDYYYTFSTVIDGALVVFDHSLLEDYCYDNTIKECSITSGKQKLNNNVFLNTSRTTSCHSNSFGNDCEGNSFGNRCHSNTFGNDCEGNSFGNDCYHNSFGDSCSNNTFESDCEYNTFGNKCQSNSFEGYCETNSFGNSCSFNSFGNSSSSNSFENNCYSNTFRASCQYNSFGNNCNNNSFVTDCDSNSFGNYCFNNTFGTGCRYNSFETGCSNNSFGDYCSYNSFGNNCYHNSFRVNADKSSSLKNYVRYNHFDDGYSYNVIWNNKTTSSSAPLKNINVNRGVSGTSSSYNYINIDTINSKQEIEVVNTSDGIYTYTITEADDNEVDSVWNKIINE